MLGPLQDRIWLHVGARPPEGTARLAALAGGLGLQAPLKTARARELASSSLPVLLQHDGRDPMTDSLLTPDETWLYHQDAVAVLTSRVRWIPPRTATGGETRLRSAVEEGRRFLLRAQEHDPQKPALALLGISHTWLTSESARSNLLSALQYIDGPVGLMMGKGLDPLDSPKAVSGLVEVVQSIDTIGVFRCDHGALGAYAFGASGGSIGLGTSMRHFVPPTEPTWADLSDPTPRVFLPFLLSWWKGSRLAYYDGIEPFDSCPCSVCDGDSLVRFQDEALQEEADAHSVACWSYIAEDLAGFAGAERSDRWIGYCKRALQLYDDIEDQAEDLQHPSKQLKAWLRFAGVPAV